MEGADGRKAHHGGGVTSGRGGHCGAGRGRARWGRVSPGCCITQKSVLTADSQGREQLSTGDGGKRPWVLMATEVCGELEHSGSKDVPQHPQSGMALYTQICPCTHTLRRTPEPPPCLPALETQWFGSNKAAVFGVAADPAGYMHTSAGTTLPSPSTAGC